MDVYFMMTVSTDHDTAGGVIMAQRFCQLTQVPIEEIHTDSLSITIKDGYTLNCTLICNFQYILDCFTLHDRHNLHQQLSTLALSPIFHENILDEMNTAYMDMIAPNIASMKVIGSVEDKTVLPYESTILWASIDFDMEKNKLLHTLMYS